VEGWEGISSAGDQPHRRGHGDIGFLAMRRKFLSVILYSIVTVLFADMASGKCATDFRTKESIELRILVVLLN
jgi:hypothetical protein